METIGIAGIGFVFGYLLYYAVRHTEKFDITLLSAAIGAVGSQAVIAWLGKVTGWIGPYGIGLFLGFLFYLILSLIFISKDKYDDLTRVRLLSKTLLGTQIQKEE
ncbi:MAG: hypothetical protein OHK0032_16650 [Thermodesulfovibrionales bacterium]